MALNETLQKKNKCSLWANEDDVTTTQYDANS